MVLSNAKMKIILHGIFQNQLPVNSTARSDEHLLFRMCLNFNSCGSNISVNSGFLHWCSYSTVNMKSMRLFLRSEAHNTFMSFMHSWSEMHCLHDTSHSSMWPVTCYSHTTIETNACIDFKYILECYGKVGISLWPFYLALILAAESTYID